MRATAKQREESRQSWAAWLRDYGAAEFFDAFLSNAQGAEGRCVHCGEAIYLDIAEGGGVPDWRTEGGDYGCGDSPESTVDGVVSHFPVREAVPA